MKEEVLIVVKIACGIYVVLLALSLLGLVSSAASYLSALRQRITRE